MSDDSEYYGRSSGSTRVSRAVVTVSSTPAEVKQNKIDGFCSKLRARVGCFVRKTRNFDKKRRRIVDALHFIQIKSGHGMMCLIKDYQSTFKTV